MLEACIDRLLSARQHTSQSDVAPRMCRVREGPLPRVQHDPWKVACLPGKTHHCCLAVPRLSVCLPNYFLETASLRFLYKLP